MLNWWAQNKPDASAKVGTPSDASQRPPMFSRQTLVAGIDNIISGSADNVKPGGEKM